MGYTGSCRSCGETGDGNCNKCVHRKFTEVEDLEDICFNIFNEGDDDVEKQLIEKLKYIIWKLSSPLN